MYKGLKFNGEIFSVEKKTLTSVVEEKMAGPFVAGRFVGLLSSEMFELEQFRISSRNNLV